MHPIPVCIFAKPPLPGRVKTRLACIVGHVEAARLASAMLCDVWSVAENTPGIRPILAAAEPGSFPINPAADQTWLQQPGELGLRIESILARGLQTAPAAIALGADSPLLTSDHLAVALRSLEHADAVIGPCDDGGFYLLGVHTCPDGLLDQIAWSCERTLQQTQERLQTAGMQVETIGPSFDIDNVSDLHRLYTELGALPGEVAPHTRHWFQEVSWSASSFRP